MLTIRLQRTGRSGHAQFRLIVQDSRFSPTRGRVVAYLGSYDPHTKAAIVDAQKASQYLENGAQPSERAALILKNEGVKLPDWVKLSEPKKRTVRHPEKRRSTRPAEPQAPTAEEPAVETEEATPAEGEALSESPSEKPVEAPTEELAGDQSAPDENAEPPTETTSEAEEPAETAK